MQNNLLILPIIAAIFLVGSLAGCKSFPLTKTVRTQVDIPNEMFVCEPEGARPTGEGIMESTVARYINSLEFSNKDCRSRLKEVQVLVKCSNDKTCNVDKLVELLAIVKPSPRR